MAFEKNRPFVKVDVTDEVDSRFNEVTSQLAEKANEIVRLSSFSGTSASKQNMFAQSEKFIAQLRNKSEFDFVNSYGQIKQGLFTTTTDQQQAVATRWLEEQSTNNFCIQAQMYYDGTSACRGQIGWTDSVETEDITVGTIDRVIFGSSGLSWLGVETLIPTVNLTMGWYTVSILLVNSAVIISVQKDGSTMAQTWIKTSSVVNANQIFISAKYAQDKIRNIKYVCLKNDTPMHFYPVIPTSKNIHTAMEFNVWGVTCTAHVPASYDPNIKNKCCIFFHGANGSAKDIWEYTPHNNVLTALLDAGYVVIASDYTSATCWGNAQAMDDIDKLTDYFKDYLNIQDEFYVFGESMGGAVSFNTIARNIANVKAVAIISPAINLEYLYFNSSLKSQIKSAYGIVDDSEFQTKTSGYDPYNDNDGRVFKDIPFRIYASYEDVVVDRTNNTDLFASKVNNAGGNVTVVTTTGDHGNSSGYQPDDVVDFLNQY